MLGNWIRAGFASGRVTTRYPLAPAPAHPAWHAAVAVAHPCAQADCACEALCPVNAIQLDDRGLTVDVGACIACGRCVQECPSGSFAWSDTLDLAAERRARLVRKLGGAADDWSL